MGAKPVVVVSGFGVGMSKSLTETYSVSKYIEVIDMTDYVYSTDEETFHDFDYIMDELRDEYEPESRVTIYKGVPKRYEHGAFVSGMHIIEMFMEKAYDEGGEWAEKYLQDVTPAKAEELAEVIVKWLNENAKKPSFYLVESISEETVVVD